MKASAVRSLLHAISDECRADRPDREHARWLLHKLPGRVLRTIGRRLDFFTLSSLRGWRLIPVRKD